MLRQTWGLFRLILRCRHDQALSKNSICFYRYRDDDY